MMLLLAFTRILMLGSIDGVGEGSGGVGEGSGGVGEGSDGVGEGCDSVGEGYDGVGEGSGESEVKGIVIVLISLLVKGLIVAIVAFSNTYVLSVKGLTTTVEFF